VELLQDNYLAAITHFEGGLQIIAAIGHDQNSDLVSPPSDALDEIVTRPFTQLRVQALYLQFIGHHISVVPEVNFREMPAIFRSVLEAKDHLDDRCIASYYFSWKLKSPSTSSKMVEDLYRKEVVALSEWWRSFSAMSSSLSTHPRSKDWIGNQLLNIQYLCLQAMLSNAHQTRLKISPTSRGTFTQILELVQNLLEPIGNCQLPRLSFDSGVIGPLFYTAIRSPTIQLRRRAISLLRHPRILYHEGIWSSGVAVAMAEKIMALQIEVISSRPSEDLEVVHTMNQSGDEIETENVLGTTWFDLDDMVDDLKKLKVSVGRNDVGFMPHVLREDIVTWDTWS
jgi:hypothetical protein